MNQFVYQDFREGTFEISVFSRRGDSVWPQARFLVHGFNDVLWTDDLKEAFMFLGQSSAKAEEKFKER